MIDDRGSLIVIIGLLLCLWFLPAGAQICNDAITASTPTSDFTLHGDGTATHVPTGLMWKRCAEAVTLPMLPWQLPPP